MDGEENGAEGMPLSPAGMKPFTNLNLEIMS